MTYVQFINTVNPTLNAKKNKSLTIRHNTLQPPPPNRGGNRVVLSEQLRKEQLLKPAPVILGNVTNEGVGVYPVPTRKRLSVKENGKRIPWLFTFSHYSAPTYSRQHHEQQYHHRPVTPANIGCAAFHGLNGVMNHLSAELPGTLLDFPFFIDQC